MLMIIAVIVLSVLLVAIWTYNLALQHENERQFQHIGQLLEDLDEMQEEIDILNAQLHDDDDDDDDDSGIYL